MTHQDLSNLDVAQLADALRAELPPAYKGQADKLASQLASYRPGDPAPAEGFDKEVLEALQGRVIVAGDGRVEFGRALDLRGAQMGDLQLDVVITYPSVTYNVVIPVQDDPYAVGDRPNPYLGLGAYTLDHAAAFGGREELARKLCEIMAEPGVERAAQLIVGASGSGKSSFILAGLVPELRQRYERPDAPVLIGVMRPGQRPLAGLRIACADLGLDLAAVPDAGLVAEVRASLGARPGVKLLILDQLEELFTQSDPEGREALLALLAETPPFDRARTHLIAAIRSDYEHHLMNREELAGLRGVKVELPPMGESELTRAITRPLEGTGRRVHPELLRRIIAEARAEARAGRPYLAMVQMAMADVWDSGALVVEHYRDLGDAIRRRAGTAVEQILATLPADPAAAESDHEAIFAMLTQLVLVARDEKVDTDVSQRRLRIIVTGGKPRREVILDRLIEARLVQPFPAPSGRPDEEEIGLIHESLIAGWEGLRSAVDSQRRLLRQRDSFDNDVREFERKSRLLDEDSLSDAMILVHQGLVAETNAPAQELLRRSRARLDEQLAEQRRNRWWLIGAVSVAAFLALGFLALLVVGAQISAARDRASAQALALSALGLRHEDPEAALLLAYEAAARDPGPNTVLALRSNLFPPRVMSAQTGSFGRVESVALSPDGQNIITAGGDRTARLFTPEGRAQRTLTGHTDLVASATFHPSSDDTRILTASLDGSARVWDLEGAQLLELRPGVAPAWECPAGPDGRPAERRAGRPGLWDAAFSPDGERILTGGADGWARLWDREGQLLWERRVACGRADEFDDVRRVAFSDDGRELLLASYNDYAELWSAEGERIAALPHASNVTAARFQPGGGGYLLTASVDWTARLWRRDRLAADPVVLAHLAAVLDAQFSPDGSLVATATTDGMIRLWALDGRLLQAFQAHERPATALAFSPDGAWLLSAAHDGSARRWSVEALRDANSLDEDAVSVYRGHTGSVWALAYLPGRNAFVTGGDDGMIRLWQDRGGLVKTWSAHDGTVWDIVVDRGGRLLTGSADGTAKLWDADGTLLATFEGHSADVRRVAFNPAAGPEKPATDLIVTASFDGEVRLWHSSGELRATFPHSVPVNAVAMSPDGSMVLTGADDRSARLWQRDGRLIREFQHSGRVLDVAFDQSGGRILTASDDGTARLWSLDGTQFLTLGVLSTADGRRSAAIESASFSPGESFILTAGWDRTARIWDARSGELLYVLPYHDDAVLNAAYDPGDIRYLTTVSRDGVVRIWQLDVAPEPALTTLGHSSAVQAAVYDSTGTRVLTASGDGNAYLWIGETKALTLTHGVPVTSAALSADGTLALTTSWDGTARLWSLPGPELAQLPAGTERNPEPVQTFQHQSDGESVAVLHGAFGPQGRIATGGEDGFVRLWSRDGTLEASFRAHEERIYSLAFSAEGGDLLTASDDQTARLWSLDNTSQPKMVFRGHRLGLTSASFSPDGMEIVTTSWDTRAIRWDLQGEILKEYPHPSFVRWATFSPDGTLILTAASDGTARLWDTEGRLVSVLPGHRSGVETATFSADGRRALTASLDATVRQHPVAAADLLAAARCQVSRELRPDEILRFDVPEPTKLQGDPARCQHPAWAR